LHIGIVERRGKFLGDRGKFVVPLLDVQIIG